MFYTYYRKNFLKLERERERGKERETERERETVNGDWTRRENSFSTFGDQLELSMSLSPFFSTSFSRYQRQPALSMQRRKKTHFNWNN